MWNKYNDHWQCFNNHYRIHCVYRKIDKGFIFNKDADKFVYAVGQGNSSDLQLAIEKAMMIAKAELADKLHGQMNKRTDLYITEIGSEGNKKVVSKIEETIV